MRERAVFFKRSIRGAESDEDGERYLIEYVKGWEADGYIADGEIEGT
jgi:hypothetical protein